jgi:AI-2 transport protein TqsA
MEANADDAWSRVFAFSGSIVFVGTVLAYLKPVLVPFVLAIFLAYLVRPFAEWISTHLCFWRRRRGRAPARFAAASAESGSTEAGSAYDPEEAESLLPKPVDAGGSPRGLNRAATMGGLLVEEATYQMEATLPHWVGVVLAMGLAIALILGAVVLMTTSVASLGPRVDAYQQRARDLWSIAAFHLRPLGLQVPDELILPTKAISSHLATVLNVGLGLLNDFILVLIFLVFLLLDKGRADERSSLRRRIDDSVSRYLVLKSLICFGLATFTFLVLYALSFPLALFVAITTYVLSFIPNLGPMVASLLPLPICLLDVSVSPERAALCVALPSLAHVLVGNLLEPQIFGSQFRMSPVVILFSLGVWWTLWGIVGAMLAVPLTSILRIIASDLISNGEGGFFILVLNQLLEGRPLDSVSTTDRSRMGQQRAGGGGASRSSSAAGGPQHRGGCSDDEEDTGRHGGKAL